MRLEIDLPEFEKELSINITVRRDGEVVYSTTSSPSMDSLNDGGKKKNEEGIANFGEGITAKPSGTTTNLGKKKSKGNLMDLDI